MKQISSIRNTTGVGQQAIASLLGITRQGLDRAEKGLTGLSTENLITLSRLQACLDRSRITTAKNRTDTPAENERCKQQELECRFFAAVAERRLSLHEAAFKKTTHFISALSLLEPADEAQATWIQKTKLDLTKKLKNCGPAACKRLKKRIYLLNAEADYLNRCINEIQSPHENP